MPWPGNNSGNAQPHDGTIFRKSYGDLRASYEPRGLRWASDYDARRPRLVLIQGSSERFPAGAMLFTEDIRIQFQLCNGGVVDSLSSRELVTFLRYRRFLVLGLL